MNRLIKFCVQIVSAILFPRVASRRFLQVEELENRLAPSATMAPDVSQPVLYTGETHVESGPTYHEMSGVSTDGSVWNSHSTAQSTLSVATQVTFSMDDMGNKTTVKHTEEEGTATTVSFFGQITAIGNVQNTDMTLVSHHEKITDTVEQDAPDGSGTIVTTEQFHGGWDMVYTSTSDGKGFSIVTSGDTHFTNDVKTSGTMTWDGEGNATDDSTSDYVMVTTNNVVSNNGTRSSDKDRSSITESGTIQIGKTNSPDSSIKTVSSDDQHTVEHSVDGHTENDVDGSSQTVIIGTDKDTLGNTIQTTMTVDGVDSLVDHQETKTWHETVTITTISTLADGTSSATTVVSSFSSDDPPTTDDPSESQDDVDQDEGDPTTSVLASALDTGSDDEDAVDDGDDLSDEDATDSNPNDDIAATDSGDQNDGSDSSDTSSDSTDDSGLNADLGDDAWVAFGQEAALV